MDSGPSTYKPALNRDVSFGSEDSPPLPENIAFNNNNSENNNKPKRNKSLVRPERERIDENHRQYHYRQATINRGSEKVSASTTGNQPQILERRPTQSRSAAPIRRGRSILGREERVLDDEAEEQKEHEKNQQQNQKNRGCTSGLPGPWVTYCHLITCCVPKPMMRLMGIPDGPAQMAWREKIGLVSCALLVMGFVGFLTFGFTQAVCPLAPTSVRGGQISPGYLIVNGWAYMLSDWNEHPAVPGIVNSSSNVLYSALNGGGMDASFLFQQPDRMTQCATILTPLQTAPVSGYFPCQLFNPNNTSPPDPSSFTNTTQCHSSAAISSLNTLYTQGVLDNKGTYEKPARVYYEWEDVNTTSHFMVYNNDVLNLMLLQSLPRDYFSFPTGGLIEAILQDNSLFGGKDMTRHITAYREPGNRWQEEAECLKATIKVGSLNTISIGCMASEIVLYVSLVVILSVIGVKFILAVIFGWFLSWKLGNFNEGNSYAARMKRETEIENWTRNIDASAPLGKPRTLPSVYGTPNNKRKTLFPQTSRFTQPEHGSTRFAVEKGPTPSWKAPASSSFGYQSRPSSSYIGSPNPSGRFYGDAPSSVRLSGFMSPMRPSSIYSDFYSNASTNGGAPCPFPLSPFVAPQPSADYMPFNFPLAHTICLITCYSEGEEGIRTTIDSIATSDYPATHKLILVICDGMITGHGNSRSTPDVCVDMMRDLLVPADEVEARDYVAIADGSKRNNMAKVYAGYYKYDDATVDVGHQQRVPMITIVKCGTPAEAGESKPGNRGKRDSQIVLMQFLQKVMFDERMTTMEYEFFNSIWRITGVPADSFEICLMVDADTKIYPDALTRLISCAVKDPEISGLCGETKIANKTDSWVSMIQVFEYYISHHQSKAFESIFGGVTCLPGCFCMYRIKAPKGPNGYWVPVLANPDIVEHYSENIVDTLHKKNLLLLGEDRYLSTLMLRTFPHRKMMFVPQAVCKTVVPDTFMVLLSQRRRWINSTIHNLMELLFVHDLCGTFCFSMQFVIFMELVGTVALPAAISFTLYLIIQAIMGSPALIPLILLALVLGLPAVLIVMTSRKIVYVGWMLVYLFSIPIWNFVLPSYAYWHFDDFSWGDTRKVEGGEKDKGHADGEGTFDSSKISMKKWSEYEKDRRIKLAAERNMPIPRFLEHRRTVDIFRETNENLPKRYSKTGSAGSNDSDAPLTQMEVLPANAMRQYREAEASSAAAVVSMMRAPQPYDGPPTSSAAGVRLTDVPMDELHGDVPEKPAETWKGLQSTQNDWADPAPHHSLTKSSTRPSSPS